MTRYCELYANLRNTSEPVWIDTVGYDDSKKLKDEDSFKEVLKFIDKHDVRDVHGIVWTVMPQERMDARYVQLIPCPSTGPKFVLVQIFLCKTIICLDIVPFPNFFLPDQKMICI